MNNKREIPEYTYSATPNRKYLKYILLKFDNVIDYKNMCKILNIDEKNDGLFSEYRAVEGNKVMNLLKKS